MKIGDRLYQLRKDRKLTLKQVQTMLAEKDETISIPYLSEIERNVSTPPIKTLKKLAGVYKLDWRSFLSNVDFEEKSKLDTLPPKSKQSFEEFLHFFEQIEGKPLGKSWQEALLGIQHRGKSPEKREIWYQIYAALKLIDK